MGAAYTTVTVRNFLKLVQELEKLDSRVLDRELVVHDSGTGTETEVKTLIDVDNFTIGLKI